MVFVCVLFTMSQVSIEDGSMNELFFPRDEWIRGEWTLWVTGVMHGWMGWEF